MSIFVNIGYLHTQIMMYNILYIVYTTYEEKPKKEHYYKLNEYEHSAGDRQMSKVSWEKIHQENVQFGSCGIPAIDAQVEEAFVNCLFKRGIAYNVFADGRIVGGFMLSICVIHNAFEAYEIGDSFYPAIKINYLAIEKKCQHHKIGGATLSSLIQKIYKDSANWPIRYIYIEALPELKEWYHRLKFVDCGKETEENSYVIPMVMDLIDKNKIGKYEEQFM